MSSFQTLFKYEFKRQFSLKKVKTDILGNILSILISLSIIIIFAFLCSNIVFNYTSIKINKIEDPIERSRELLCLFFLGIMAVMSILGLEQMRKSLSSSKDKVILLRLPVKPQTIFLSKLAVLMIWNYLVGFLLIFPIALLFYLAIDISFIYWLKVIFVWLILPLVSFLLSCLLIIPYILVIDFIKKRYILVFISLSGILILGFLLYSKMLNVFQGLLETGSIKFIFNEGFTKILKKFLKYGYPANCFSSLILGKNIGKSILIMILSAVLSVLGIYYVTKELFFVALYRTNTKTVMRRNTSFKERSPLFALMKKEFIMVFRTPSYVFSYFAIAASMPIMCYCCYKILNSLIVNTIGISASFALALIIILVFSVLTNTFCATNISRDKAAMISTKTYPIKASKILLAKILFCSVTNVLSLIMSVFILIIFTSLNKWDGLICLIIGLMFSTAQILLSTKMDLNHTKPSFDEIEMESISNKTISKVVTLGFVLALFIGTIAFVIMALSSTNSFVKIKIHKSLAYILPVLLSCIYLGLSILYYVRKINQRYLNITA